MNYRHVYHAGNFADVLKHVILTLAIERLKLKEAAFRIIDTHAGVGLYPLNHGPAEKTGEWRTGIARLFGPDAASIPQKAEQVLRPYLDVVAAENGSAAEGRLTRYPGSPQIARRLMRADDQLVVNELHEADRGQLDALFEHDDQVRVLGIDGWVALKSLLPPKERRGLVLIDPPFEEPGELIRLTDSIADALRRFETGVYLLWYPIKDPRIIARFHRALGQACARDVLIAELMIRPPRHPEKLNGCGVAIINPPWQLEEQLKTVLPLLADRLGEGPGSSHRLERIVRDHGGDER